MAVVINEFDVESEPAAQEKPGERKPGKPPAPPDAREIERILRQHKERCLRVWAH